MMGNLTRAGPSPLVARWQRTRSGARERRPKPSGSLRRSWSTAKPGTDHSGAVDYSDVLPAATILAATPERTRSRARERGSAWCVSMPGRLVFLSWSSSSLIPSKHNGWSCRVAAGPSVGIMGRCCPRCEGKKDAASELRAPGGVVHQSSPENMNTIAQVVQVGKCSSVSGGLERYESLGYGAFDRA